MVSAKRRWPSFQPSFNVFDGMAICALLSPGGLNAQKLAGI
jgi:hypothetical protein